MKTKEISREIFTLSVRLLGLVMIFYGVNSLAALVLVQKVDYILTPVIYFAAAFWLFKGPVIRWVYPEPVTPEIKAEDVGTASPLKAHA